MNKILVIDDKHDNLVTIEALLKNSMPNVRVITAQSGPDGLQLAREVQPHTILLDIKMPDMDGYEVCRRLKADAKLKVIPVIMLTALMTDSESRIKGFELGADAFLGKPVNGEELVAQIKVMLRIKTAEDALREERDLLEARVQERALSLKMSEEKYRLIVENANDGIEITQDDKIIFSNTRFAEMLGYSVSELESMAFSDIFSEQALKDLNIRSKKRDLGESLPNHYETTLCKKDGTLIDVEVKYEIIEYQGEPATFAIVRDITEHKQAEKALQESEAHLRNIFENSTNMFYSHTPEHEITYVSPQVVDILGYTQEEVMVKWTDFASDNPLNENAFKSTVKAIETGIRQPTYELEMVKKNGEKVWVEVREFPVVENGKTTAISGSLTDITETKTAQLQEEIFRNKLLEAQETAGIGSWDYSFEEKCSYWTPELYRIFGLDENYGPIPWPDHEPLIHPDDWERIDRVVNEAFTKGTSYSEQFRIVHKDGSIVWAETRGNGQTDAKGNVISLSGTVQNITELKKAEEEREQVFNQSFDMICTATLDGYLRDLNPAWEKTLGWTHSELRSKPFIEFIHPDDHAATLEAAGSLQKGIAALGFENRYLTKDGSYKWLSWNTIPVLEKNMMLGIARDITDHKQAEEKLRESEERFNLAMNASNDGLFDWDLETNVIYYSPAWKKMIGYEDHELPNDFTVWEETTAPEDVKKSWEMQQKLISKQIDRFVLEFKMKHKDGHWVDILSQARAVFDDKGKAIRIVGTHTDISEREQFIKTIQERNEYIESIMENMPIGFALNTISDGDVKYMNDRFEEIYGWSRKVLTNTSIFFEKVFPGPEYREKIQSKIIADMESGDPERMHWEDLRIVTSSGEVRYVSAFNIPIPDQDLMISTVQDSTERKQAEEERESLETQLRQSQKLEAVGTMVGGIAHEFNNILQGLFLYSRIVNDRLPDDEELRSDFQQIVKSSERAKHLVKQILTFSRKHSSDRKPAKIQVPLIESLKLIKDSAPSVIEIKESIDENCAPVLCDTSQISQIFTNLYNNALHAMAEKGGTLNVSLQEVNTDIEHVPGEKPFAGSGTIELVVSDTGHGMDEETREQIFDPFFTTKSVDKGTGLGLSIVHGIITDMGGQIKVESEVGKGTTFTILLPATSMDEEIADAPEAGKDQASRELNILFVDDEESISNAAKSILEKEGYRITLADNGEDGLKLFEQDIRTFEMVITDLSMPGMSGVELGQAIRELSKDVLLLLSTGELDAKLQQEYLSLGFDGLIRKPWAPRELKNLIHTITSDKD